MQAMRGEGNEETLGVPYLLDSKGHNFCKRHYVTQDLDPTPRISMSGFDELLQVKQHSRSLLNNW